MGESLTANVSVPFNFAHNCRRSPWNLAIREQTLRAIAKALLATASADRVASSFRTLGPTPED